LKRLVWMFFLLYTQKWILCDEKVVESNQRFCKLCLFLICLRWAELIFSLILIQFKTKKIYISCCSSTTSNSLQHQAALGQQSHTRSFSLQICLKLPSLKPPKKSPFSLNLSLWHLQTAFLHDLDNCSTRTILGNL